MWRKRRATARIWRNCSEKRNKEWVYEYSRICKRGGKIGESDGSRESNLYADEAQAVAGVDAAQNRVVGDEEGR